jgi:hypothetical protein
MEATDRDLFARSIGHAVAAGSGSALDDALGALGWHEALAEDPRTAVSVLFELIGAGGAGGARSSALAAVLGHGLGLASATAAGLVLPRPGRADPPGRLDHDRLAVHGLTTVLRADRSALLVAAAGRDGVVVAEVSVGDLTLRAVDGVAPRMDLVEVTGTDVPHTVADDLPPDRWARAVALARLAVGHELVGTSNKMLELARQHALERVQFDRPISSFQAVRHRLADTLVAVEAGDATLQSAWEEGSPEAASVAKAVAGRGARTAARHCQQVLAGMGFTSEHEFHHCVRRALVLDQLFGAAATLPREFGGQLLATRQLPALPPL